MYSDMSLALLTQSFISSHIPARRVVVTPVVGEKLSSRYEILGCGLRRATLHGILRGSRASFAAAKSQASGLYGDRDVPAGCSVPVARWHETRTEAGRP